MLFPAGSRRKKIQLTLLQGEWLYRCAGFRKLLVISTHTLTRGVTVSGSDSHRFKWISTHTPARGVTPLQIPIPESFPISTHTPARGVTVKQTIFHLNIFLFFTQFTSFFHQTSPYFHFISFFTQNPGANLPVVLMSLLIRTWYALLTANMSHFYQKISCFSEAISKCIKTAFYAIAAFSLNHFLENTG